MTTPYKLTITVALKRAESRYQYGNGISSESAFFIAPEKFSDLAGVLIDVDNFCKQLRLQIGMSEPDEKKLVEQIERGRLG